MGPSDLGPIIEKYRDSLDAIVQGDPEPQKRLWSRADDVSLANPLGPPVVGWERVEEHLDRAAATVRDGEPLTHESVSEYSTGDLGYTVGLERSSARFDGADELTRFSLRVTTVFRREAGQWRIVHRHADSITAPRPAGSLAQQT